MKKMMIVAAAALMSAATLCAQNVAPIDFEVPDADIIALRSQHPDQSEYLATLEAIRVQMEGNKQQLKDARKQLNEEKKYQKNLTKGVNEAIKSYKKVDAACRKEQQEIGKLKAALNTLNTNASRENKLESTNLRETYMDALQTGKRLVDNAERENDQRLRIITREADNMNNLANTCTQFAQEIAQKEADLKAMEAKLKANAPKVQAEIKNQQKILKDAQ